MDKADFASKMQALGKRIDQLAPNLTTEEATKNALIMPFFQALGFDIFNPLEFVPEYTADVGIKKGEKVDYGIVLNDKLSILVECKEISEDLKKHDSQLFRYFGTTEARFGILTNGRIYKFFTDLDEQNKMDSTPFLTIDLSSLRDAQITELFRFTKDNFDVDKISSTASNLKYVGLVKEYLNKEMVNPSDDLIRLALDDFFDGMKTKKVIEKFRPIFVKGFNQLISESVNDKLSHALNSSVSSKVEDDEDVEDDPDDGIITTPAELETYTTAKVILSKTVDITRIFYRDNKSYFNILLDDNIRKWLFRVYFTNSKNWIELNDDNHSKIEFVSPIDLVDHSQDIINAVMPFIE
ncbi:type I restriction endonuclease [Lacticaseibacillus songhuajiangensis]|uniref:type I restriction endonuclease n=1 Tax=Lacticaseibacillus songhuajiangensis TaxID=1296539 RepID=UPI000F7AA303|nr:type I restriction endonuclease [Lacticaseibacillus songhuajiangensis]